MGQKAIAKCQWWWWHPATHKWVPDEEPNEVVDCRASIGNKIVTVWLPKGAMIRRRRPRTSDTALGHEYRHTYGRDRDRQIRFTLHLEPNPEGVQDGDRKADHDA